MLGINGRDGISYRRIQEKKKPKEIAKTIVESKRRGMEQVIRSQDGRWSREILGRYPIAETRKRTSKKRWAKTREKYVEE